MVSIAIFNNKGGVGKTTLICNLASYLNLKENKRVLVIDADPHVMLLFMLQKIMIWKRFTLM